MLCFTENGNMTLTCGICSIGNAMAETRPLFHCYRTMISGGYCVANVPNRTNCVLYGCVAQLDVGHVYVTPWPNPTRSDATHPVEGRDSPPTAVYVVSTRNKMYSSNVCDYVVILPEMRFIFLRASCTMVTTRSGLSKAFISGAFGLTIDSSGFSQCNSENT